MKSAARVLAGISLAACVALPFVRFWGGMEEAPFKLWLAICSVAWFVFATYAMARRAQP